MKSPGGLPMSNSIFINYREFDKKNFEIIIGIFEFFRNLNEPSFPAE